MPSTSGAPERPIKKVLNGFLFSFLLLLLHPLIAGPEKGIPTGPMTTARLQPAAALLPDGRVLVAGGYDSSFGVLASAELYDPTTGTFSATGAMTAARAAAPTATLLPTGKVLIAGGVDGSGNYLASAEIYDPAAGAFSAAGPMTAARYLPAVAQLPKGRVLIAGGGDSVNILASAELYIIPKK